MDRVLNIAGGLVAAGAVLVFWMLVVVIIPAFLSAWVATLLSLPGQWKKRRSIPK